MASSVAVPGDAGSHTPEAELALNPKSIAPDREDRLFLLLSIFLGIIAALLVVLFRIAIEWCSILFQGSAPQPHQLRLIWVPTLAGLVVGVLTRYVFPAVRGTGINQTKAAFYIHNGYISIRTMVGKFMLCSVSIGAGFSTGPEDPSLHIGAAIASLVGRTFGLSREKLRILAPVGAAAGLAAAFNAPISAILFVIEEVIGQWGAGILGAVVVAAISAVVVARWFWGVAPMFRVPVVTLHDPRELIAYGILGIVGGVASLAFSKALGTLRPWLRRQSRTKQMLQPTAAGFLVGCIGYFGLPQVMGAGYGAIDQAMHAQFAIKILLLLAVFKIVATTISFASGSPGGVFAPTLFVGAMLGAGVGAVERHFFPELSGSLASYALVGMGVLFAAFLRVPLTSVFMVLEVSANYSIIVPVLLANTIAYCIARSLEPISVFESFAQQDGLLLPSMEEMRDETELRIEDGLVPVNVPVVDGIQTPQEVRATVLAWPGTGGGFAAQSPVLVRCSEGGWYAANWTELEAVFDRTKTNAGQLAEGIECALPKERTPILFPDLHLAHTLTYFHRWPILPISSRANRTILEGVVSLADVLQRFERAAMPKANHNVLRPPV
jgi:CIC family chloride channel protein